jgi:ribosomal protein L39E
MRKGEILLEINDARMHAHKKVSIFQPNLNKTAVKKFKMCWLMEILKQPQKIPKWTLMRVEKDFNEGKWRE